MTTRVDREALPRARDRVSMAMSAQNWRAEVICRELLRLSVDGGFGTGYLLAPISIKLGIDVPLYDSSTESGVLWNLGPYGLGLLDVADDGRWASVNWDTHEELEVWSREPLEAINGQG